MSGNFLATTAVQLAFGAAVIFYPTDSIAQRGHPGAVAQEKLADAKAAAQTLDEFVKERTKQCDSGNQNVHKTYFILVDQSTSIDSNEWGLMMKGLYGGITDEAVLSEFNLKIGGQKPRFLLVNIQFSSKAMLVNAACVETLEDMKRFAAENFSGNRGSKVPGLGAYTHIHRAFSLSLAVSESFGRLGWKTHKRKAVLVADGREQGSEPALRAVLKEVEAACMEVDTVAIVPKEGAPGGNDNVQSLIQYLDTIKTPPNASCKVKLDLGKGRVWEGKEPLQAGAMFPAWGFGNVAPAVRKALGLSGG